MGLFDIFTRPGQIGLNVPISAGMEGPSASTSLAKVVYAEYFAGELGEVTRLSALQIPAIKKARDVLVGIVAGLPLREYEGEAVVDQPWLYRTASSISPWHRLAWVFDDLFFYDWSALAVARDGSGQITDAIRIPFERWSVDEHTGVVRVDFAEASGREVVLIPGNGSGGILAAGAPTITGAGALQRAWIGRAQNPIPLIELHQNNDDPLTDGDEDEEDNEIQDLVDTWSKARTSPTGAVGFTPSNIDVKVHGTIATDLYEEGRNAIVLDIARLTGLPAALLDGSMSTASLTYSTQEGKRNEFLDYTLPMWLAPIEARLSMDDVSGTGRVIRFDKSDLVTRDQAAVSDPKED